MRHLLSLLCIFTFFTSSTLHAQPPSYVPTSGLVGWWPFNGNANDESGNGNNGTVNGATLTQDRFGNANAAFSFDGVSDFISTNFQGVLGTSNRSVAFWAKHIEVFDQNQCASCSRKPVISYGSNIQGPTQIGQGFHCEFNIGLTGISFDGNETAASYSTNSPVNDNSWHYYVYVLNNVSNASSVLIYQDGVLLTNLSFTYLPNYNINTILGANTDFGRRTFDQQNPFFYKGDLDDIGFWNRVLEPCEIQALYTASVGGNVGISSTPVSFSGLSTSYNTSDAPSTLVGSPSGGYFIGPGVVANTFNPSVAGEGNHSITYTWFDACGGFNTYGLCTSVSLGMGLQPGTDVFGGVKVFPNPNRGLFTVELELNGLVGMQVFDARGALVHNEVFTASGSRTQRTLDLSAFAKGSYTLLVEHGGQRVSQTVVVE